MVEHGVQCEPVVVKMDVPLSYPLQMPSVSLQSAQVIYTIASKKVHSSNTSTLFVAYSLFHGKIISNSRIARGKEWEAGRSKSQVSTE